MCDSVRDIIDLRFLVESNGSKTKGFLSSKGDNAAVKVDRKEGA